ncbi:hypothetical protein CONPUDRAFT_151644 [Coniophora puteana RWD-64-598 SS2]|uniref:Uncharacterized protein n=1 Tax=Coniophora puteana (strain RWD-64-598) TaxID=741705 RepID=A0A5M3MTZ0_CONPW|nr:uncharacterized protein CONPUDRAFT_151644 [Coniophora puteana RWD-64-598 SS2]EIW82566.1 hypothetical protein CONPUDRAFT_151644 [Coniophora puteana RWD-64-598 SS2]
MASPLLEQAAGVLRECDSKLIEYKLIPGNKSQTLEARYTHAKKNQENLYRASPLDELLAKAHCALAQGLLKDIQKTIIKARDSNL